MIVAFVVMTVSCERCLAEHVVGKTHPIFVGDCWSWRNGDCACLTPCLMAQVDESHDMPDAARLDDDVCLDRSWHDNSSGSCCPSSRLRSNVRPFAVLRNMNKATSAIATASTMVFHRLGTVECHTNQGMSFVELWRFMWRHGGSLGQRKSM